MDAAMLRRRSPRFRIVHGLHSDQAYFAMEISVTGRQMEVGAALTGHVEQNLEQAVNKYFDGGRAIDAAVAFGHEGPHVRVDITVHPGPRGVMVKGGGAASDAYSAFDVALERISKQLRRYKRKLTDHHRGQNNNEAVLPAQQYVIQAEDEEEPGVPYGDEPVIVADMPTEISTLTVGEAVMRMDLADQPALMFRNRGSGVLNVVYRRPDGNIGWIDPAAGG